MDWLYWEVDPDVECIFRPVEDDMYEFIVLVSCVESRVKDRLMTSL